MTLGNQRGTLVRGADGTLYEVSGGSSKPTPADREAVRTTDADAVNQDPLGISDYAASRPTIDPGDYVAPRPMVDPGEAVTGSA